MENKGVDRTEIAEPSFKGFGRQTHNTSLSPAGESSFSSGSLGALCCGRCPPLGWGQQCPSTLREHLDGAPAARKFLLEELDS